MAWWGRGGSESSPQVKGVQKIIAIKIKYGGDLGHFYAGSIKYGGTDKLGGGRGRIKKRVGERKGSDNRHRLLKTQKITSREDRDKWVSAEEAKPLLVVVAELSTPGRPCVVERRELSSKSGYPVGSDGWGGVGHKQGRKVRGASSLLEGWEKGGWCWSQLALAPAPERHCLYSLGAVLSTTSQQLGTEAERQMVAVRDGWDLMSAMVWLWYDHVPQTLHALKLNLRWKV